MTNLDDAKAKFTVVKMNRARFSRWHDGERDPGLDHEFAVARFEYYVLKAAQDLPSLTSAERDNLSRVFTSILT